MMNRALSSNDLISLPGRYARALFELAMEKNIVNSIDNSLRSLCRIIQSSPILLHSLNNPVFSSVDKQAVLEKICNRIKAPELLTRFAAQLVQGKRILYLQEISRFFQIMIIQDQNQMTAAVITAVALTHLTSLPILGQFGRF